MTPAARSLGTQEADTIQPIASAQSSADSAPFRLSLGDVWRRPLPWFEHRRDRWLCRALTAASLRWVLGIEGSERIAAEHDPFIAVANHSARPEAVLVPTLLMFLRGGKRIHFLADWAMALVPGVGWIYRRSEVILATRKSARLRYFDRYRPRFDSSAFERCRSALLAGSSIGIFPEGTMNRQPARLLPGRVGAARLALDTGVPVVPIGLRFPCRSRSRPIGDLERLTVEIGRPLPPPRSFSGPAPRTEVRSFHRRIMTELSALSGKEWRPGAQPRRNP